MSGLPDFANQRMLAGVCLWLSQRLGWSVWGLRAAALLGLWLNPLITGILYLAGGWWVNRGELPTTAVSGSATRTGSKAPEPDSQKTARRQPVIIEQKPRHVEDPVSGDSESEEIHAHSERVEALLKRYRALDEQLDRQT